MFSRFTKRWAAPQGYRDVLGIGLPLVASMVSSTVMQFTDRLFLSHYSVTSIAAALPSAMAAVLLQLPLVGLCGYVSVLIAQYYGAGRRGEVGSALWQGLWLALAASSLLVFAYFAAPAIFAWGGHPEAVAVEEVIYFRVLILGSVFLLGSAVIGGFFTGLGRTRPVFVANIIGAVINIPLDYLLIFGSGGLPDIGAWFGVPASSLSPVFPELGIAGAGIATVAGWAITGLILGFGVFRRKNDAVYRVISAWRPRRDMFARLIRYGVPSGINVFMELVGFAWFTFEVGRLSETALAASNIAFSVNMLVFMPMLGLNTAVATMVGQAMGRGNPHEAEKATSSALHLSLMYMLPLCVLFVIFAGQLMDLFRPGDPLLDYGPIRATGMVLIYYVALYTLVDSFNIVYLAALKGAGDTLFVMLILGGTGFFALILPILLLKHWGLATLHSLWIVLTIYVMVMAFGAWLRFRVGKWRSIRMVEQSEG